MADCPGITHLAAMADGGLARLRIPGGRLTARQARAVADAAATLGSGVIDLTNRANLQIRGLGDGAGGALFEALAEAGLVVIGPADRRRNILIDPFSGLDGSEAQDLRPLARRLDRLLIAAPWIGGLSPKFSFVLDGGGRARIAGVPSDVTALAHASGLHLRIGRFEAHVLALDDDDLARRLTAIAEAAASAGLSARGPDLTAEALVQALGTEVGIRSGTSAGSAVLDRSLGVFATSDSEKFAAVFPAPVGRLDPRMLRWLADAADSDGDGHLSLAPWSAVVVAGLRHDRAAALLRLSEGQGFTPVEIARRLSVTACAGAPACERAQEPAKAIAVAALDLAAREPWRLPDSPASLHLSACGKGCAGSASADLLALGSSERAGWTLHREAAPRAPGQSTERLAAVTPAQLLAHLCAEDRTDPTQGMPCHAPDAPSQGCRKASGSR